MGRPEHWGDGIVKTQGMTRAEVEAALARAGLEVPEREKPEIAAAAHFIEEMAAAGAGKARDGRRARPYLPASGGVRAWSRIS